jgi:hypothetical protein
MTIFERLMVSFGISTAPDATAPDADRKRPAEHRIGEYIADYSPLSPDEIAAAENETLTELYKNSRPVSR